LQFAALFDCVDDVLAWVKDREGRYCWVNRAFSINYSLERGSAGTREEPDEVVGKTDYDFSPALVFFTDGDLDMDASQKADLLSFVRTDGKGFIGVHSAAITFLGWPEYGEMLGGYVDGHPWGVFDAPIIVEDSAFPGLTHLPRSFVLRDEIYQIKDYSRANVRVLLRLDAGKIDLAAKGIHRRDRDFAVAWAKDYGKGRVLYNGLGHTPDVWERPGYQEMWLGMVRWALGISRGDATPRPAP
jgi:type 1 glutamine amidotransferase